MPRLSSAPGTTMMMMPSLGLGIRVSGSGRHHHDGYAIFSMFPSEPLYPWSSWTGLSPLGLMSKQLKRPLRTDGGWGRRFDAAGDGCFRRLVQGVSKP